MAKIESRAPAKINLTLHVTGRRADGLHLVDSLVVFADFGDLMSVALADRTQLRITGPMAADVSEGRENLVAQALETMGVDADITLDKHLPVSGGIGGGSSDAAAVLRALAYLTGRPLPTDRGLSLGADLPVCLATPLAARIRGIGEQLAPVPDLPEIPALLVNPGRAVPTGVVFAHLACSDNPPMPEMPPQLEDAAALIGWLRDMRNDLEGPATVVEPAIAEVLTALMATPGCGLARMSGSGATCVGLFERTEAAKAAAGRLAADHPAWWVARVCLNPANPGQLIRDTT